VTTAGADFSWCDLPHVGGRVENPGLRQPISLIVDDPNPGYNPAYFHLGFRYGPMYVPRVLIDEVADLVETTGIRGKFSVIPNPFGLGRIDRSVQGLTDADVAYFLDVVRARIAPALDITPEALTHWNAIDLATGCLLPFWEHIWSRGQDRRTLRPYLALALEILNAVDLPSSGMTSPWDFGAGVEDEYAEALLSAQRQVNAQSLTWYFLQADGVSLHVPPRLQIFRPEAGEAVVSIVCCDMQDFGYDVWTGGAPKPDVLISADGRQGRLAQVLAAGGPAAFHTHWQTLFGQGAHSGLPALGTVVQRLEAYFGDRIVWTRCSDMACYAAASAAVRVMERAAEDGVLALDIAAPFPCEHFTLSVAAQAPPRVVRIDGAPLNRVSRAADLRDDSYVVIDGRLYLCWSLRDGQSIAIESA
jgi:hypothetical protein